MKKTIASLLVFALLASGVCASQAPDQKHIAAVKRKVSTCLENSRHVTIQTYDGRELQGSISEAAPDSFVLSFHGNPTTLDYSEVKSIKWPSPMSKPLKDAILVVAITGGIFLCVVLLGGLRG